MYAVIETGGKQISVRGGDIIYVEKLDAQQGDTIDFDVLLLSREGVGDTVIGTPKVDGAKVIGKVLGQVKGEKLVIYKFKSKKNERKKKGHRQPYTKLEITAIEA